MLIFNFHHVEAEPKHEDRRMITISPDGLRNFIRTFRLLGFRFVSINEIIEKDGPKAMSPKDVLMTFDDGFSNNYDYAAPVLNKEKCPALIFALPGHFSGTNTWDHSHLPPAERDQLMSLEQIKELAQSPYITFGSHGVYHQHLPELSADELHNELHDSHRILSEALGDNYAPIMAYPWGDYNDTVLEAMKTAPYKYGFTVEKRRWLTSDDPHTVPRLSAYFRDGNPLVLAGKLARHQLLFG